MNDHYSQQVYVDPEQADWLEIEKQTAILKAQKEEEDR